MSIKITNLSFSYPDKKIFNGASFEFKSGVFYSLSAPSGVGKTTLFRIITGLEKPMGGEIEVIGKVAYMFQEDRLFPSLTVFENLKLVTSDEAAINKALERLGVLGEKESYPDELSGGMKRRIALARALVFNAENVLLDEPFGGLDEKTKENAILLIQEFCREKTLIIVTHDPKERDFCSEHITL